MRWHLFLLPLVWALLISALEAGEVIQIDTSSAFNVRPINTVVEGKIVPQNENIDGAGGVATAAAVKLASVADPHTMPDDAKFPATEKHPEIVLAYAKDDGKKPLAFRGMGESVFAFSVPQRKYEKLFLICTSGWGASALEVKLKYEDNSIESRTMEVPDWFWELKPDDPYRSYVATDLSKWNANKMLEADHHYIFALDARPSKDKVLTKVLVKKGQPGLLVFYGATGVTAD